MSEVSEEDTTPRDTMSTDQRSSTASVAGILRWIHFLIWRKYSKYLFLVCVLGLILSILRSDADKCNDTKTCLTDINARTILTTAPFGLKLRHDSEISLKQNPAAHLHFEKWIVVTTKVKPTDELQQLSLIPGWKLVVVADENTPLDPNWALENSIFLDIATQKSLNYKVVDFLPWNSYARKILGYLYAIENGAKFIYDAEDGIAPNEPETFESNFILTNTTRGLILDTKELISNPYLHFGQYNVKPFGYPTDNTSVGNKKAYSTCHMRTPLIQQGLVDGNSGFGEAVDIRFDRHAPPVVFPKSTFVPFNSKNTLFRYDAFWSLFLPASVPVNVTDIYRGYWAQSLLRKIGGHVGFFPPNTIETHEWSHFKLSEFNETKLKPYNQILNLVRFLSTWKCNNGTLFKCMLNLTQAMGEQKMWPMSELDLMHAWIADLRKVGYKEPAFQKISSPCLNGSDKSVAIFTPMDTSARKDKSRSMLLKFCNLNSGLSAIPSALHFPKTLLVVTFNTLHYRNIGLLDLIYRPHYPNMVYCGRVPSVLALKRIASSESFKSGNLKHISFVRVRNIYDLDGSVPFECALRAIDMGYSGITGYLIVSDDMLLNFWNTVILDRNEMWIQHEIEILDTITTPNQVVAKPSRDILTTIAALKEMYASEDPVVKQFCANLKRHEISSNIIFRAPLDMFYVPVSKQEMFYAVGTFLWRSEMFLDYATPLLAFGLSSPNEMVHLHGKSLRTALKRNSPFNSFHPSSVFLHPVKLSQIVVSNGTLRKEYCKKYVSHVLSWS